MSRRREIEPREIQPDPRYGSQVLAKFINRIMERGKKSLARDIVYEAFDIIEGRTKREAMNVFKKALENVRPIVEVKSRRVGGATYQVPVEVSNDRAMALAMRWIIEFARKRGEKGMVNQLVGELIDAEDDEGGGRGKGGAVKKREDTHRMAEANKAFSHYRW
jgi:small subunit ribosomal protein S7